MERDDLYARHAATTDPRSIASAAAIARSLWDRHIDTRVRRHYDSTDIMIECLRIAGCKCNNPLIGYKPHVGVRCRLCNTQHEAEGSLKKLSNIPELSDAVKLLDDYGISVDDYKELIFALFEECEGWLCFD